LHVRTSGKGARAAVDALMSLVRSGFGDATDQPAVRHG
jgi:hypothetical protein